MKIVVWGAATQATVLAVPMLGIPTIKGDKGDPGEIPAADRARIDAAIVTAETINGRIAQVAEAVGQTASDRSQTGADRAAALAARQAAEQERQAAEAARVAAAQSAQNALGVAATMIPGRITFGWLTDSHYASRTLQVAASHGGMERTQDLAISVEEVPVWESETTALVARMATQPSVMQQIAYNTLIRSLKSSGAWPKLVGLKVLAVHSRQAAMLDWVNAAYDMVDVVGPIFTVNRGMTGDGAHSLTIPFNPRSPGNALYSQESATLGLWMIGFGGQSRGVFGNTNTRLGISSTGTLGHGLHNLVADIPTYGGNHVAARRASAAGYDLFRGGMLERTIATASAQPTATNFSLMGAAGGFTTGQVAACYWGSGTLTNAEMAAINTALSTYLTSVGAA